MTSNSSAGAELQAPSDHNKWFAHRGKRIRVGQAQRTSRNRYRPGKRSKRRRSFSVYVHALALHCEPGLASETNPG
ncbi:unnamed protein product [Sphagnum tenellum]